MPAFEYKRILWKISGGLVGGSSHPLDMDNIHSLAKAIVKLLDSGYQLGIVIGGGNIIRGVGPSRVKLGIPQEKLDTLGMLATIINCLAVAETVRALGKKAEVFVPWSSLPFTRTVLSDEPDRVLNQGGVAFFAGGTGSPRFSTDTAAALRAAQIKADVILKGTRVDGVYDKDPLKYPDAKLIPKISAEEVLQKQLKIVDSTALFICIESKIPIIVYNAEKYCSPIEVLKQDSIRSIIEPV